MILEYIKNLYSEHKEQILYHRYITNNHIEPLLNKLGESLKIDVIGKSVLNDSIYAIKIGSGPKKIFMWSQMHGNESTTTKAIFDLLNTLLGNDREVSQVLNACTILIIPILNPDGAKAYTRINANEIDLMLSDVIMPNMDGYKLAAEVRIKYPNIKIQLVSGFDDDRKRTEEDELLYKHLLNKPYSASNLFDAVRKCLHR